MLFILPLVAFLGFPGASATPKVVQFDFERHEVVQNLASLARRGPADATVYNAQTDLLYLVNVTVGTPPQKLSLQIDTGSSDIWIPWARSTPCSSNRNRCTSGAFDETRSTSYELLDANRFLISYVDGTRISGDYISDAFSVGGAQVPNMTMGLAKSAREQDTASEFQGIIGVGFETGEAVFTQTGQTYPNIISRLKDTGNIKSRAYSLWLNDKDNGKGSMLFGGIDTAKYTGDLVALPIQPDTRSSSITSFTVALDSFNVIDATNKNAYSRTSLGLPVILDSGTTITYLPDDIAADIYAGVGATSNANYGVVVPCDLQNSPATINFGFGNSKGPTLVVGISNFVLPFPSSIPPPQFISSRKTACRWGLQAAQGRPLLFGDTFLRAAYVVYNIDNNQLAIAQSNINSTKSNVVEITGTQLPGVSSTATGVAAAASVSGLYGPNTMGFRTGASGIATATGATWNLGATSAAGSSSSGSGSSKKGVSTRTQPDYALIGGTIGIVFLVMSLGGCGFAFFLY